MSKLHYKEDLAEIKCQCGGSDCNNDVIVFRSNCHPDAPTWSFYDKKAQALMVICAECDELIIGIAVACETESISNTNLN